MVTNSWRDMGRGLSGGERLILVSGGGQGQRCESNIDIERVGNTLVLRPVVQATILYLFSPDFMAKGREFHEQGERDWSGNSPLSIDAGPGSVINKAQG